MGRKHYPQEYREQMVSLARSGRSFASLADEFEPTAQTIRNWVREHEKDTGSGDHSTSKEVRRLKRQLARIQEERDILAKATAWFAKETTKAPSGSTNS